MSRFHQTHRVVAAKTRLRDEDGQALIEYALVLALIAIVSVGALKALGLQISDLLNATGSQLSSVSNP